MKSTIGYYYKYNITSQSTFASFPYPSCLTAAEPYAAAYWTAGNCLVNAYSSTRSCLANAYSSACIFLVMLELHWAEMQHSRSVWQTIFCFWRKHLVSHLARCWRQRRALNSHCSVSHWSARTAQVSRQQWLEVDAKCLWSNPYALFSIAILLLTLLMHCVPPIVPGWIISFISKRRLSVCLVFNGSEGFDNLLLFPYFCIIFIFLYIFCVWILKSRYCTFYWDCQYNFFGIFFQRIYEYAHGLSFCYHIYCVQLDGCCSDNRSNPCNCRWPTLRAGPVLVSRNSNSFNWLETRKRQMAELHVLGQLFGATGFDRSHLFCKWAVITGDGWRLLEGVAEGQTQVDSPEVRVIFLPGWTSQDNDFCIWAHPIDMHYASKVIAGWPKLHLQVWSQDNLGRSSFGTHLFCFPFNIVVGYGFCHIPTAPGTHEVRCATWKPVGSTGEQIMGMNVQYIDML